MTNAEENRKILKGSLDYTICKRTVFISGIVIVAMTMVLILLSWAVQSFRLMLILIPAALFCIPIMIINGHRMGQITKCQNSVLFFESVLTDPQPCFNAGVVFSVTLKDSNGQTFQAKTHAIAQTRGLLKPNFSELNGKKALIAYSEPSREVFVVKIL